MEGAKLDEFLPLDLGWISKSCKDWPAEDTGPILLVVFYLWPKAGRAPNDVRKLAKVAGVSPRVWERIRKTAGDFFRVDGEDLVQDFLVTLHAEKSRVYLGNRTKAKKGAAARWGNHVEHASSNAPSNASSIPPSCAPGYAKTILRASSYSDLKYSEEEKGSNATGVPSRALELEEEISEALAAYPKTRSLPDGGTTEVRMGDNARDLCRAFLAARPAYPLALAARYTAKRDRMPRDFENWIKDPPAADRVLEAWDKRQREKAVVRAVQAGLPPVPAAVAPLRDIVEKITTYAPADPAERKSIAALAERMQTHAGS